MLLRMCFGVFLLATALSFGLLCSDAQADHSYASTEYSLEWLTDACSGIAVSEVHQWPRGEDFSFAVYDGNLLKKAKGFKFDKNKRATSHIIGRGIYYTVGPKESHVLPVYSEPSTYPPALARDLDNRVIRLREEKEWRSGDRCVLFFGKNSNRLVHVINLNRPVPFEDRFLLAADMYANLIIDPDDLIERIKRRVAEGRKRTPDGSPWVCADGLHYYAHGMPLEGNSYYGLVVPPDASFKETLDKMVKRMHVLQDGERKLVWYWFYSGKKPADFRADWQKDFDRFVRDSRQRLRMHHGEPHVEQVVNYLNTVANWPHGWHGVMSPDGHYLVYNDAYNLYLYDVHEEDPGKAKLLYKTDQFVPDGRYRRQIKFHPEDNTLVYVLPGGIRKVLDLKTLKLVPQPKKEP